MYQNHPDKKYTDQTGPFCFFPYIAFFMITIFLAQTDNSSPPTCLKNYNRIYINCHHLQCWISFFYQRSYILALFLGMVSFDNVASAGWFQVPPVGQFGLKFVPSAIAAMVILLPNIFLHAKKRMDPVNPHGSIRSFYTFFIF